MSLLTELFGKEILLASLAEVKEKIKNLPTEQKEKKSYLLKDYASIKGIILTQADYDEIGIGLFK